MTTPDLRVRRINSRQPNPHGEYVVYWMTAFRRVKSNFALQRAIEVAEKFKRPLLVVEALRAGYPFASDRLHRFVLQGMGENARRLSKANVASYFYVEPEAGAGRGMLEALARDAVCVVTDDFPSFFLPRMVEAAGQKLSIALEAVDSNGLWPMRATERVFTTAHSFRTFLQKELKPHLSQLPQAEPLDGLRLPELGALPKGFEKKWPRASEALLRAEANAISALPIDHSVGFATLDGGSAVGEVCVGRFVDERMEQYPEARNEPALAGTSGLSPYLHFGHVGVHQVFAAIAEREKFDPASLGKSIGGAKEGWWKLSKGAEAFLDELVTWRELAFNMAALQPDQMGKYESLPSWARASLEKHENDERPVLYSLKQLERAETHDELWNAAMRQMTRDGWFHNYVRMLWGKKILEWSKTPREALSRMEALMNKYSLDGRNPCSYSGYLWVLGRYDRAWGERPIFGKVRYMSSENTARKLDVKPYLRKYAAAEHV